MLPVETICTALRAASTHSSIGGDGSQIAFQSPTGFFGQGVDQAETSPADSGPPVLVAIYRVISTHGVDGDGDLAPAKK